ncbi:MAG: restriction endonuclease subunit S [Candidatus Hydrogenedentes bacterium]|nr:restriction endonuclease subunit S [Candidatus Hydrogenedentota bacterium]
MGSEWKRTALGRLIESGEAHLQTGPFGTALKAAEYSSEGVPLISVREIREGHFEVGKETSRVSQETTKRLPQFVLDEGDIVFGRKGATDRNAIVHAEQSGWFLGSDGIRLRLAKSHNSRFFSYQMRSPSIRQWLVQNSEGTTMPSLNQGILGRIPIVAPPLPEQRAIAHILGTLDDKIELNRRMNETLEGMARALFKSWFVDFDPVRAKAEGRDPGLPKDLADLFPDEFADSELGEIPKGWRVYGLDEIAVFLNGLALQKYPPGEGRSLAVIKIAQLRKGDTSGADRCSAFIPVEYFVDDGDVLFSWSGSLECVLWSGGLGALNQHLFKVTSDKFPKWFYYLWIHEHLGEFRHIAAGKATTMGHIQRGHLSAAKVLVPPQPLLDAMTKVMSPLIATITVNATQSRTLAALRDMLLPKLISGELRVEHLLGRLR